MNKRWICLLLAAVFLFGGCSSSMGGIDSLLQPPRLTEEQNEIYRALRQETEGAIKLVYPRQGSYRSAFILTNLDDEPTQEAVVFYQQDTVTAAAVETVRMKVLDRQEKNWVALCDIPMESTQVEDVTIMNVGTGVPLLAVGLNYASDGGNLLRVYEFKNGELSEIYVQSYRAKKILDFDFDDKDEIFFIDLMPSEVESTARLIGHDGYKFTELSNVAMNPDAQRYVTLTDGYLRNGQRAIYIDEVRGNNLWTTEIVAYQTTTKSMQNLTYQEGTAPIYPVDRVAGAYCRDLNNDGVIEVPGLTPMLGYSESETPLYLTNWYHFADGEFVLQKASYVDSAMGYLLQFPNKWIGRVSTCSAGENEMLFYEYREKGSHIKEKLLYLKVMTKTDWEEERADSEYSVIDMRGQIVYLAKIPTTTSGLRVTLAQVKEYFNFYL